MLDERQCSAGTTGKKRYFSSYKVLSLLTKKTGCAVEFSSLFEGNLNGSAIS
jgi:hypothetical protein